MQPVHVHVQPQRTLFVAVAILLIIRQSTTQCIGTVAGLSPTGIARPAGIACDAWGNLYVGDAATGAVIVSSVDGSQTQWLSSDPTRGISRLALDRFNNLFLTGVSVNAVHVVWASNLTVTLLAGSNNSAAGFSGDGGLAAMALLNGPNDIAVDATGNVLIADTGNSCVRAVQTSSGVISRTAGTMVAGYSGDGGPATRAQLNLPSGVAVNRAGDVYIADTYNNVIRVVRAASLIITTFAGQQSGSGGFGGDGFLAVSAQLRGPTSVAVAASGDVYIADTGNACIRAVFATNNTIATIVGNASVGAGSSGNGGPALAALLISPTNLTIAPNGNLYFWDQVSTDVLITTVTAVDTPSVIRVVFAVNGTVDVVVGQPPATAFEEGELAVAANIGSPGFIVLDAVDNLYVSDDSVAVYVVHKSNATVNTFAGNSTLGAGYGGDGGPAAQAQLNIPSGLALALSSGDLFVADSGNCIVRAVSAANGTIATFVGLPAGSGCSGNGGPATLARLSFPTGLVTATNGDLYISDTLCHLVRVVYASNRTIAAVAGVFQFFFGGYTGDGSAATLAQLNQPHGLALDAASNLYIADTQNNMIRVVWAGNKTISRVAGVPFVAAGSGYSGFNGDGHLGVQTWLDHLLDVAVAQNGDVYFSDTNNNAVRVLFASNATVTSVSGYAGKGSGGFAGDNGPVSQAVLSRPAGIAFDSLGNMFIADTGNQRVRAVVNGPSIACPAGHSCGCGTPVACTNTSQFCPPNQLASTPVAARCMATPDGGPYTAQLPCPVGYYCVGGARVPCAAGSVGTAGLQLAQAACRPCAAGTYSALPAQSSLSACVPCPRGWFSATPGSSFCSRCPPNTAAPGVGSASAGACVPCRSGTASLGGSGACFALDAAASITTQQSLTAYQVLAPAPADPQANKAQAVADSFAAAVPIAGIAAAPLLLIVLSTLCGCAAAVDPSRRPAWLRAAAGRLALVDAFALRHAVAPGTSPTKAATELGGAMTLAALGTVLALAAALLAQFALNNVLVQQAILPALLPTVTALTSAAAASSSGSSASSYLPPRAIPAGSAAAAPYLARGVALQLRAAGPRCGALLSVAFDGLLPGGGAFTNATALDGATQAAVHTLQCADCAFGPLTVLTLTLDASCQQLELAAAAVGAQGTVTAVVVSAQGLAAVPNATGGMLSAVAVTLQPTLETFVDTTVAGGATRGYTLSAQPPSPTYPGGGGAADVTVTVAMALAPDYVSVQLLPIVSPAQLVASLIGLLGVVGVFGAVFSRLEPLLFAWRQRRGRLPAPSTAAAAAAATEPATVKYKRASLPGGDDGALAATASPLVSGRRLLPRPQQQQQQQQQQLEGESEGGPAPTPRPAGSGPGPRRSIAGVAAVDLYAGGATAARVRAARPSTVPQMSNPVSPRGRTTAAPRPAAPR